MTLRLLTPLGPIRVSCQPHMALQQPYINPPFFSHAKQQQDKAKHTLMDLSVEKDLLVQ